MFRVTANHPDMDPDIYLAHMCYVVGRLRCHCDKMKLSQMLILNAKLENRFVSNKLNFEFTEFVGEMHPFALIFNLALLYGVEVLHLGVSKVGYELNQEEQTAILQHLKLSNFEKLR